MSVAYLDASAIVKLVVKEPESAALMAALEGVDRHVTSRLVTVEVMRAAARRGRVNADRLHAVLDALDMIELTDEIASRAGSMTPTDLRSLDAVHLASALGIRRELTSFVVYDERLANAARLLGLPVLAPT